MKRFIVALSIVLMIVPLSAWSEDKTINSLEVKTTPGNSDKILIWDVPAAATKSATFGNLATYRNISPSANVQTILGSANYAAIREYLSVRPGVDVQVYDADLDELAAISGVQGDIIYHSAVGWTRLAAPTSDYVLRYNTSTSIPYWGADSGGTGGTGTGDMTATYYPNIVAIESEPVTNTYMLVADGTQWQSVTPASIRTNLGLVISTNVQAYDADLTTYGSITPSANVQSLLGAATYSAMRTLLSLVPGTNVQTWDADLDDIAGISDQAGDIIIRGSSGWERLAAPSTDQALRYNTTTSKPYWGSAGVGDMLVANYPHIDAIEGLAHTDSNIIVGNGTTWVAESGSTARTSLGVAIGTDVQAYDADLTTWAGVTSSANGRSLVSAVDYAAMKTLLALTIGTNVQAWDTDLDTLAAISGIQGDIIIRGASGWTRLAAPSSDMNLRYNTGTSAPYWGATGSGDMLAASYPDLVAIEALASTGLAARTSSNVWAQRTITGTTSEIEVSNGNGVSGNPTIGLPDNVVVTGTLSAGAAGFTVDADGDVVAKSITLTQSASQAGGWVGYELSGNGTNYFAWDVPDAITNNRTFKMIATDPTGAQVMAWTLSGSTITESWISPLVAASIDTSAELATILGDEEGSGGGFVRATSPTLTTPTLGAALATSIQFTDQNASPSTVGVLQYDNTITGLDDGGIVWYDGDEIQTLIGMDSSTTFGTGQDGYQVTYHYNSGSGYFDLQAAGSGGIANIVEDTTPQLGGDLDLNGHSIIPTASNDPYISLAETDGTDWWMGIYDAGNVLEWRQSATVNTNVMMTLSDAGALVTAGSITSSGTFDVTGAAQLVLGSSDVTSWKLSGMSEDLVLTPSADKITATTTTGVATLDFSAINLATTGTITGRIPMIEKSSGTTLTSLECQGGFITVTAAGDYVLPAAATVGFGSPVVVRVRDVSEVVTLDPNGNEKINIGGAALAAGYKIKSSGAAGDQVLMISTTDSDGSGTDGWIVTGMYPLASSWLTNGS